MEQVEDDVKVIVMGKTPVPENVIAQAKEMARSMGLKEVHIGDPEAIAEAASNPNMVVKPLQAMMIDKETGDLASVKDVKNMGELGGILAQLLGGDVTEQEWNEWSKIPYNGVEGDSCDCPACNSRRAEFGPDVGIDADKPGLMAKKGLAAMAAGDPLTDEQIAQLKSDLGGERVGKAVDAVLVMKGLNEVAAQAEKCGEDVEVLKTLAYDLLKPIPHGFEEVLTALVDVGLPPEENVQMFVSDIRRWTVPTLEKMTYLKAAAQTIDGANKLKDKLGKDTYEKIVGGAMRVMDFYLKELTGKGAVDHHDAETK